MGIHTTLATTKITVTILEQTRTQHLFYFLYTNASFLYWFWCYMLGLELHKKDSEAEQMVPDHWVTPCAPSICECHTCRPVGALSLRPGVDVSSRCPW